MNPVLHSIAYFRARSPAERRLALYGIILTLLGLALRIAGARGDLWLDEVHSILLSQSIHRADEVFWNINHDNNHFLNTLYLFLIGPDHSSIVLRLEAIVFGTLSIPAAGLAAYGRRRDAVAAVAAMLFTAIAYPSVHYGSEERGYAGMALFTFLAIGLAERGLKTRKEQILLGIAALLGALSYLFIAFPLMALGLWRGIRIHRPGEDWFGAMARAAIPFWAAIIGLLFPILCIQIGNLHHTFQHGGEVTELGLRNMGLAVCRFFTLLGGLPESWPLAGLAIVPAALVIAGRSSPLSIRDRAGFCTVLCVLYLAYLMTIGAMSSLDHPRYLMPLMAPVILLMADCVSIGLHHGRLTRIFTIVLLAAWSATTLGELAHFYAEGRGHYSEAVIAMTNDGPATYTSDVKYGHSQIVDFYAARLHRRAIFIPPGDMCVIKPDWLLVTMLQPVRGAILFGPDGCPSTYADPQVFSYWGLAGWRWVLYRRVDAAP